jgi:hypothetical protein
MHGVMIQITKLSQNIDILLHWPILSLLRELLRGPVFSKGDALLTGLGGNHRQTADTWPVLYCFPNKGGHAISKDPYLFG